MCQLPIMPQGVRDSVGADMGINPQFGSFWHVFLIIRREMASAYQNPIIPRGIGQDHRRPQFGGRQIGKGEAN
jgi:hypothetical protein